MAVRGAMPDVVGARAFTVAGRAAPDGPETTAARVDQEVDSRRCAHVRSVTRW
ncbi:hypothetical protein CZ774_13750 [Frigoribacterium sp. JB110]|nr:hypothetical protein CZ774_13750 [Frigoribacterium sp. JB110]